MLISCIEVNSRTTRARNALIEIGTACEEEVPELLQSSRVALLIEGLRILDKVGTNKSLAALEKAAAHRERSVAVMARTAIRSVKEREEMK